MKLWQKTALITGLLLIFIFFSTAVLHKEQLLKNGTPFYIELVPKDPRSKIQGDYMILNYNIPDNLQKSAMDAVVGKFVFTLNDKKVAQFLRIYNEEEPLAENEYLIYFNAYSRWRLNLGANSFFFQEGQGEKYSNARYGELRVEKDGKPLLVGLRDEHLELLGYSSGLK